MENQDFVYSERKRQYGRIRYININDKITISVSLEYDAYGFGLLLAEYFMNTNKSAQKQFTPIIELFNGAISEFEHF